MKKLVIIIVLAFMASVISVVIAQDFKSTSDMMSSGSKYTPAVYSVGATSPTETAAPNRGRMATMGDDDDDEPSEWGDVGDYTPIGAPLLPLVLMAAAYGTLRLRRKEE